MPRVYWKVFLGFGVITRREKSSYCLQMKLNMDPYAHLKDKF